MGTKLCKTSVNHSLYSLGVIRPSWFKLEKKQLSKQCHFSSLLENKSDIHLIGTLFIFLAVRNQLKYILVEV